MRALRKLLLILLVFALFSALGVAGVAVGVYFHLARDLPKITGIDDYRPAVSTRVLAADGSLIGEFFEERRDPVPLEVVPQHVRDAFLGAEDADFYHHPGIDIPGIVRAAIENFRAGEVRQGASTITQQVVKRIFLSPERKLERKLKEWILAYRLERYLSKDDILEIYLNEIYFGHGAYGIEVAAQTFFGKSVTELTLAEASLLAGLPKAPNKYNPYASLTNAKIRQQYVLDQMVQHGMIDADMRREAYEQELALAEPDAAVNPAAEYVEWVRRDLVERYGNERVLRGGLVVETALDPAMQDAARAAVQHGLRDLDKRMGYRGPVEHVAWEDVAKTLERLREQTLEHDAVVTGLVREIDDERRQVVVDTGAIVGRLPVSAMEWASPPGTGRTVRTPSSVLEVGDVIRVRIVGSVTPGEPLELALEQEPEAQGALLALDPATGYVRAMIGAYDPAQSEFNRATQARRQPGSSFKPIIYTAAFEAGRTPGDIVVDSPIIAKDDLASFLRGGWKPANFDNRFKGPITIRDALAQSRNVPTIKVLKDVGVGRVLDVAKRLHITAPLDRDLTLALGSSGLPLIELAGAYGVFASGGIYHEPIFIQRVTDRQGKVIEEHQPKGERVLDEDVAFQITFLLEEVVRAGTGRAARDLGRPAAGKTGTTNDYIDAWFMGFTPDLVCGVWTGIDERRSLGRGETGGRAALPIWLAFMKDALEGRPVLPFREPSTIEWRTIAAAGPSGMALPFRPGTTATSERLPGIPAADASTPQLHMLP